MTLFVVPLESYDLRYTEQWNRWFPEALVRHGIPSHYLDVDLGGAGTQLAAAVLDPISTNRARARQVDRILDLFAKRRVVDDDVFLFHTLWFPGLETLAYLRDTLKIRFRMVAVLHAGTYDPWDFRTLSGMDPWSAPLETAWMTMVDRILVGSEFHKQQVLAARSVDAKKIVVTGLPFRSQETQFGREELIAQKANLVAFPHRPTIEKSTDLVEYLRQALGYESVIVTREQSTTKSEYLDLLAGCKVCVSDSLQETWGYSMLESVALDCVPLVPNRLSYVEMYPARFRFDSRPQLVAMIKEAFAGGFDDAHELHPLIDWANGSLDRVLNASLTW